ncbi:YeeE/YedE family protein, partial [Staphylococcus aureus]|uniref:YeeE/YedE family protein n=1 Tax=Staphylococcus aureus TaxID=1280 RepID=UPI0021B11394
ANSFPILGTIICSFIFVIGIVLAVGCATGTWYRAGEWLIGSWIALVLYAVTASITKTGILKKLMYKINQQTNVNSDMSQTTGIPFCGLVVILTIITIFLDVRTLNNNKYRVA